MFKKFNLNIENAIAMLLGLGLIVFAFSLESENTVNIFEPTALLVVLGGSFCACFLHFSFAKVFGAIKSIKNLFIYKEETPIEDLELLSKISLYVRKNGILSLKDIIPNVENEFLKKCLKHALEIREETRIEEALNNQILVENRKDLTNIEIFEELGGYAPTFGIVGAIIGLIQIASSSQSLTELMPGIATAFCATLWGLALANLVFLPIAGNYRNTLKDKANYQEVVVKTVLKICRNQSSIEVREDLDEFRENLPQKAKSVIFSKIFRKD